MPKILILHASLGTGHISAANALGKAFDRLNIADVQIEDILDYASALVRSTLTKSYLQVSEKSPALWRMFFEGSDAGDLEGSLKSNVLLGQLERAFFSRLEKLVQDTSPDALVCVHPAAAALFGYLKKDGKLSVPMYVVVTDFIAHSTWFNHGVDGYFLPGDVTRLQFLSDGIPENLLHVTGIPVNLDIADPKPMDAMRQKHNLPQDKPLITLFGGGIVAERVHTMVELLLRYHSSPMTLAVVAGRNQALLDSLSDLDSNEQVELLKMGRIDFVDDLVAASDVAVSKAGGLITSEILARGTPLVIIDPIPGQEEWNADVVAESGAGVQLRMPEMAALTASTLLSQPERLAAMRQLSQTVGKPRAALDMAEIILQEI